MQYTYRLFYIYFNKPTFVFSDMKYMQPTVSVIMAAYNAEKHISKAIESVINQTFTDFELLIINDGSTDNTKQIIEKYCLGNSNIKLINNKENLFVIKSRNIGMQIAEGEYVAILDSDDLAFPDRLEKQVKYLEENPEVFLIGGSATVIEENGNYSKDSVAVTGYNKIKNNIHKNNLVYHSTVMFRNSKVYYREKMLFCEDYDLVLNLISENKIIDNLPDILVKYRTTEGSLSRKDNQLIQWLFINKAREFYYERIKNGTDSYEVFNPDEFIKLEDIDYQTNEKDLSLSLKLCFYRADIKTLRHLLFKYKKYYSISKFSLFYSTLSAHKFIFNLAHKLHSKL